MSSDTGSKIEDFIREWRSKTPYIEAHTSGSTGKPKEIRLPKQLVRESALRSCRHFGIREGDRLHLCLSPDYIAGKMLIVRALEACARLTFEGPSSAPLAGNTDTQEIRLISIVGSQLEGLRRSMDLLPQLRIRHLLAGGAPLTSSMRRLAAEGPWDAAWESYGMTETASHVALRRITPRGLNPFEALDGIHFSLTDEDCLIIHLPGQEPLITNDIAELLTPRSFVLRGRRDNVVITGGLKVFPEETERAIGPLIPKGRDFYVTSEPSEKWGRSLLLLIEGIPISLSVKGLYASGLPHWQLPKRIIFLPEFRRTSTGKIIRTKL